jgi:signal peptidase I
MTTAEASRRRPWVAVLLHLIAPGCGHIYSGYPVRGLLLYVGTEFLGLALLGVAMTISNGLGEVLILTLGVPIVLIVTAFDAYRRAKAAPQDYRRARYNRGYVYVLFILISFGERNLMTRELQKRALQAVRIPTQSMEPVMLTGDQFLLDKRVYWTANPQRGDIAAYSMPDTKSNFVKRVIGLPGETIEIRKKQVFINGNPLSEPYTHFSRGPFVEGSSLDSDVMKPTVIPDDSYFVLGDNRDNSLDSRFTGPVHVARFVGKVTVVYFSWDSANRKIRWDRIGKRLQ